MTNSWVDPAGGVPQTPSADVVQAGFLKRWAALFLDQLILGVGFYALVFIGIIIVAATGNLEQIDTDDPPLWLIIGYLGAVGVYYVLAGLYYALMESSARQATVGKMALGIKVVDRAGQRLSFGHALARWFAAALSYLTLYIGFLMAGFTHKKQALHDLVAGTYVVDRWAYTEHPDRQSRGLGGCVIVFVVAMVLLVALSIVGILAAIAIPAYQDYVARSQFSQVEQTMHVLAAQVEDHLGNEGDCPTNDSAGFLAPSAYASTEINRIVIGEFDAGYCGISAWLPPLSGNVERQFIAEIDMQDGRWYCTSPLSAGLMPDWCE